MTATLVQSTTFNNTGAAVTHSNLPGPVTAGHLLVVVASKTGSTSITIDGTSVFINGGVSQARGFTKFAAEVFNTVETPPRDALVIGYRVATGDEQFLDWYNVTKLALYEYSGTGSPATFEVKRLSGQGASSAKALPAFTIAGDAQVFGLDWGNYDTTIVTDQVLGSGYTQDIQAGTSGAGHPGFLAAHGTAGSQAKVTSGQSAPWAAMAVGITGGTGLTASFTATPTSGHPPLAVTFTDTTTGSPTAWSWTFGDTGTSSSQNPSHTYLAAGSYTVTLTATKTGSTSTATHVEFVVVIPVAAAGVYIDWDDDGFGVGAHDNVSDDTVSWDITRGASAEITGGAQPGTMTLGLKNPADLYNPRNASGALYGKLHDGPRVWVGINSDGKLTGSDPRGLFAGRITDITLLPAGGASVSPTVEIVCEDMLTWASRKPVSIDYAEGRSHATLREMALLVAGETRYSLAHEIHTMPLSHADSDLMAVLQELNGVNGTRHFAEPADNFTDWFTYRTRNRFWHLDGATDSDLDAGADHVTDTAGWRLAADTVTNEQRATVQPIVFTPGTFTVWQAQDLPYLLTARTPRRFWVDFDDVVTQAVTNLVTTGSTVASSVTLYGASALVVLTTTGSATITSLSIEGRLVRRPPTVSYVADNSASQTGPRGVRAGGEIQGEYLGVMADAVGIASHIVWRYPEPQFRPTVTVENWFPDQFDRDLYDNAGVTSTQLDEAGTVFEIVGLHHVSDVAAATVQHHTTTYVLQESRVQSDPGWFLLDDAGSLLDGVAVLSY